MCETLLRLPCGAPRVRLFAGVCDQDVPGNNGRPDALIALVLFLGLFGCHCMVRICFDMS